MLAGEGFDPPTFGLWAQHASSAPYRLNLFLYLYWLHLTRREKVDIFVLLQ